jgi:hypothetical protein
MRRRFSIAKAHQFFKQQGLMKWNFAREQMHMNPDVLKSDLVHSRD